MIFKINKKPILRGWFFSFSEQAKNFLENNLIPQLNNLIDEAKGSGKNLNEFFKGL